MQQGQEVGAAARALFPNGMLVMPTRAESGTVLTARLVAEATTETLFEAAFSVDDALTAKADILTRVGGGWHLIEVKSSFSDTGDMPHLIADLAYTAMVIQQTGIAVDRASLMLLSRAYRHGMPPDQLFESLDKTGDVQTLVGEYEPRITAVTAAVLGDTRPPVRLGPACRRCEFFAGQCLGVGHSHTVLELPSLHYKKFKRLAEEGVVGIGDVPEDMELTERQERVRGAALSGAMFVSPDLLEALQRIQWPCHYLDFETIATVLPLFPRHACHQQVVTQFSVHRRETPDAEPTHSEFLAHVNQPDERHLAEALLAAVAGTGSIIVYSNFEKTRLKALQVMFSDLHEPLEGVIARLVDLNAIVSAHVYHPAFRGSSSVKVVLPTLVPDLSYDGLAIGDGDTAISVFARMARRDIPSGEVQAKRAELLEYCRMDSLAILRLHESLAGMAT